MHLPVQQHPVGVQVIHRLDAMRQALATSTKKLDGMGRRGRDRVVAHHRTETEVERLAGLFATYAAGEERA